MASFRVGLTQVVQELREMANANGPVRRMGWQLLQDKCVIVGKYDDARVAHTQGVLAAKRQPHSKFQLMENCGGGSWVQVAEYSSTGNALPSAPRSQRLSEKAQAARKMLAYGATSQDRWNYALANPSQVDKAMRYVNEWNRKNAG